MLCWRLLPALHGFTRVFLYAHEGGLIDQLRSTEPGFASALQQGSGVWAGSQYAAAALRRLGVEPLVLEYGVEAPQDRLVVRTKSEAVIAVLATMEPRKGLDLAIKGFLLLPDAIRAQCRLRIAGRPHDLPFHEAIKDLAAADPRISMEGALSLEQYRRALAAADIVLCPSRDDPLPLVSLNALAEGKILICSQEVGTAAYIRDGASGFVLPQNRPVEIAEALARVLAARRRWPEIGAAARQVFAGHFSESRFDTRLLALLDPDARIANAAD